MPPPPAPPPPPPPPSPSPSPSPSEESTEVRLVADAHRYEILLDGVTAGFAEFRDRGEQRVFFHTVVDEPYTGRGVAATLVGAALDDTRAQGRRAVPVCSYVERYLSRHEEYQHLADEPTPQLRAWLSRELSGTRPSQDR